MRASQILLSLILMSAVPAVAQVRPPVVAEHIDRPTPALAVAEDAGHPLDLTANRVTIETKAANRASSIEQANSRLTQFLYSVALGVVVAVVSTLLLRAIV